MPAFVGILKKRFLFQADLVLVYVPSDLLTGVVTLFRFGLQRHQIGYQGGAGKAPSMHSTEIQIYKSSEDWKYFG